jgi:hypothetical protein
VQDHEYEKSDWATLYDYILRLVHSQGYNTVEGFMQSRWAKPLITVYGEGKIRAYAAQAVEKLRGGG